MRYFGAVVLEGGDMNWKTIEMAVAYERMVYTYGERHVAVINTT